MVLDAPLGQHNRAAVLSFSYVEDRPLLSTSLWGNFYVTLYIEHHFNLSVKHRHGTHEGKGKCCPSYPLETLYLESGETDEFLRDRSEAKDDTWGDLRLCFEETERHRTVTEWSTLFCRLFYGKKTDRKIE